MRRVAILGSTGSVGTQALQVIRDEPESFRVVALAAGTNGDLLNAQASEFEVPSELARLCGDDSSGEILSELASHPEVDVVVNGVVGFAGLPATLAALKAGKRLALANKESLIAGGPVVARAREHGGGEIIPVDSEHSAIYQALRAGKPSEIRRILVTASGGPFRGKLQKDLAHVTTAEALAHPTWNMGPKITIDSSTLMNKGLEVIEAHVLFGVPMAQVEVVVHPESIIHGMVEFTDGATIAQLSRPDMRLPIGYALGAPERRPNPVGVIDWTALGQLSFESPDTETFSCLALAYEAGRIGGSAPAVLNGANEVAVAAFLAGEIGWLAIAQVVEDALGGGTGELETLEDVLDADRVGRQRATLSIQAKRAA